MVWHLIAVIIIRCIFTRIIHGIAVHIFECRINRRLDRTIPENRALDRLVVTTVNDQRLLQMFFGSKIRITHAIAIRIIFLKHRTLPCRQICNTHRMLATAVHIQRIAVTHRHMIDGEDVLLHRTDTCLQRTKRCKRPACAIPPLIPHR